MALRAQLGPAAAWLVAGLLLALLARPISDAIWILFLGVLAAYSFIGLIVLAITIAPNTRRLKTHWPALISVPAAALLWLGTYLPLSHLGDAVVFQVRFASHEGHYRRLAAAAQAGRLLPNQTLDGNVRYLTDRGPPTRLAFIQPGGMLDNYEAVVFDPTGEVASAKGWRDGRAGDFTATPRTIKLFGGDLVGCEHVKGAFYRCSFT